MLGDFLVEGLVLICRDNLHSKKARNWQRDNFVGECRGMSRYRWYQSSTSANKMWFEYEPRQKLVGMWYLSKEWYINEQSTSEFLW